MVDNKDRQDIGKIVMLEMFSKDLPVSNQLMMIVFQNW